MWCRFAQGGCESRHDAVDIVLVDLCLNLIRTHIADLAYLGAGPDAFAQHGVEHAQLSVDGRLDSEVVLALAYHAHVELHVLQTLAHALHLGGTEEAVLHLLAEDDAQLFLCQLVVFLGLEVILLRDQLVGIELCCCS